MRLKLFENKIFLILLGTIGIFSFATLNKQGNRKRATQNGLLGFLIALMSYLDYYYLGNILLLKYVIYF